ncbi:MAG TPA: hypothetical protein VJZ71_18820 [Phycisphaerae bacterium]|nr:hypothetical protein [Phycisphaerae bacterium]
MKRIRRTKWIMFATMTVGSVMQLSTCREETALLGLRTAISSITLPINTLIQQFFFVVGTI